MGKKKKAMRRRPPKSERAVTQKEPAGRAATKQSPPPDRARLGGEDAALESDREETEEESEGEEQERDSSPPSSNPPPKEPPSSRAGGAGPSSRRGEPLPEGAAWARPLVRIEKGWTWFESRLLFVVLITLVAALSLWVSLNGLAAPLETDNSAGTVFRAITGAGVLGLLSRLATRRRLPEPTRNWITTAAVILGIAVASTWRANGVEYFGNVLNWLQEGSSLTLFGGLRGVATRLTILLALVGASLAAGSGKHINIDVLLRLLKPALRKVVYVIGCLATSAVCFGAAWGFFDYISIEGFGLPNDAARSEKVSKVNEELSQQMFIWRKQISLDVSALPAVVGGTKWDDPSRMNGRQWNEFIEEGGFRDYFEGEGVDGILAPPDALEESRIPFVVMPGHSARGLLIHPMNLMWCLGLLIIGLRVLMRMLLVAAGHSTVEADPDEFEQESELEHPIPETMPPPPVSEDEPAEDEPEEDEPEEDEPEEDEPAEDEPAEDEPDDDDGDEDDAEDGRAS